MVDNSQQNGGRPATKADFFAGASLGAFLGILMGLSTAPVVSIVITGVVALFGTFFGLSDRLGISPSEGGTRRLIGFALSAAVVTLLGVWIRTYQLLTPSIERQKGDLQALGYANGKEQTEMLTYLRYGLLPTGMTAATDNRSGGGVLYLRATSNVCDSLSKARTPADIIQALGGADSHFKGVADKIKALAPERQADAADVAKSALCREN